MPAVRFPKHDAPTPAVPVTTTRRQLLSSGAALAAGAGSAAIAALGGAAPAAARAPTQAEWRSNPVAVPLAGPALLEAFMKMRAATDSRIVIGWMDAVTYAFIEGETLPLYRLFAATWYRFRKVSPDLYEGVSLEIANFHDIETGAPLQKLTMPRTGTVVDVPRYRAGPTKTDVVLRSESEKPFGMQRETQQGESFFRAGLAKSKDYVTQPERDGDRLLVREDIDTRVIPDDPKQPGFFYREWTIRSAPWDVVMDPKVHSAPTEVIYTGMAAFRPWMKMTGINGHTVQNGRGGKVERVEELPTRVQQIVREWHPDLVADAARVLERS